MGLTDGRTQPGQQLVWTVFKLTSRIGYHTASQPAPTRMNSGNLPTSPVTDQNRQAIGRHHGTNHSPLITVAGICAPDNAITLSMDHIDTMNLFQQLRRDRKP